MPSKGLIVLPELDAALLATISVKLDERGIEIPEDLSVDEWLKLTQHLVQLWRAGNKVVDVLRWAISDALAFGEKHYGNTYTQLSAHLGLSQSTLANWASMARRMTRDVRNPLVSHAQSYELAFLPPDQRAEALALVALAEENGESMTTNDVRALAVAYRARSEGKDPAIEEAKHVLGTAVRDVTRTLPIEYWPQVVQWSLQPMLTVGNFAGELVTLLVSADETFGDGIVPDDEGEDE